MSQSEHRTNIQNIRGDLGEGGGMSDCNKVLTATDTYAGSRICQRHGREAEHDIDYVSRACRVQAKAEELRDTSELFLLY